MFTHLGGNRNVVLSDAVVHIVAMTTDVCVCVCGVCGV